MKGAAETDPMPELCLRLAAVARRIESDVHCDVGSDHGYLLRHLLAWERIRHGIAIEKVPGPLANSARTLQGYSAEVRLADGLAGLAPREADSLSLCGMGGERMAEILAAHPERIPGTVVAQPNNRPEWLRRWGRRSGFRLVDEEYFEADQPVTILCFSRTGGRGNSADQDPAYDDVDPVAAELFGPWNLRRGRPDFLNALKRERAYLQRFPKLTARSRQRLVSLSQVLGQRGA